MGGVGADGNAKDTRNYDQKLSLETLLGLLKNTYPDAIIYGHRDFLTRIAPL